MHKNKKASSKMILTYCTTWSRTYHQTLLVFHTHSVSITVSYLVLLGIQSAYLLNATSILCITYSTFYVGLLQSLLRHLGILMSLGLSDCTLCSILYCELNSNLICLFYTVGGICNRFMKIISQYLHPFNPNGTGVFLGQS